MSYSVDFRRAVIENIESGKSWEEVIEIFSISRHTLSKWLQKHRSGEGLEDSPRRAYKVRKIDAALLQQALERNEDATLEELAREFNCWPPAISRRLKKLGITRKKNHAIRRKKREKTSKVSSGFKSLESGGNCLHR